MQTYSFLTVCLTTTASPNISYANYSCVLMYWAVLFPVHILWQQTEFWLLSGAFTHFPVYHQLMCYLTLMYFNAIDCRQFSYYHIIDFGIPKARHFLLFHSIVKFFFCPSFYYNFLNISHAFFLMLYRPIITNPDIWLLCKIR